MDHSAQEGAGRQDHGGAFDLATVLEQHTCDAVAVHEEVHDFAFGNFEVFL